MKWIKSKTAQNMFGLWLAYLLFLILMHKLQPNDPWTSMLARPVFLVLAPLLVACIPLLAATPKQAAREDYVEDGSRVYLPGRTKPGRSATVRKMTLVWLVSLVVFALPIGNNTLRGIWAPLFHNPIFLLVAPLLLACIPWFFPRLAFPQRAACTTNPPLSRFLLWKGIVACIILAALVVGVLLLVNDSPLTHHDGSGLWPNILFTIALFALLARGWYFIKLLRKSHTDS